MVQPQPVYPPLAQYTTLIAQHAFDAAATLLADLAPPLVHAGQLDTWLDLFARLPLDVRATRPDVLVAAGDVWRVQNKWHQASACYHQAVEQADALAQQATKAQALARHALVCWLRGDVSGSLELYAQAIDVLATADAVPDVHYDVESGYALALSSAGRLADAEALLTQQLRRAQRTAHAAHEWMTLHNLAIMVYLRRGAFPLAEMTLREALHLATASAHLLGEAYLTNNLAHTLLWQGHAADALALGAHAYALGDALDVPNIRAFALLNQAQAYYQQGDNDAAAAACAAGMACLSSPLSSPLHCELLLVLSHVQHRQHLAHACHTAQDAYAAACMQGDHWTLGQVLVYLTEVYLDAGQLDRAHRTLAEAHAIFTQYDDQYHLLHCALLAARLAHGQQAWSVLRQHVQTLMADLHQYPALMAQTAPVLADLIAAMREHDGEGAAPLRALAPRWGTTVAARTSAVPTHPTFTPTEWQVVRVLRDGKTNQQIAAQLCMSSRAVRFHLTHIYTKLGVANRSQAVAWIMVHDPPTG